MTNGGDAYGFFKHKKSTDQDYILKADEESEYLNWVFRTNQNFAIYLPGIDQNPKGNISISELKEIDFEEELKNISSEELI